MKHAPHKGKARMESTDLSAPAKTIANSSDIKAARSAFLPLRHARAGHPLRH